jgi:hypothetical protein
MIFFMGKMFLEYVHDQLVLLKPIFLRWDYLLFAHGVYGFILLAVVFIIAIYNILMGILIFCIFPD